VADERPRDTRPGALVVDLSAAIAFGAAIDALGEVWANVPPAQRAQLSRLVWLHPDGQIVIYAAPDGPPVPRGEGG